MLTICSIASPSELAATSVLREDLRTHHPGADVRLIEGPARSAAHTGESEPRLLANALADGAEIAVYLDPRMALHGPLDLALSLAREHGVVLTRRTGTIPDDGESPGFADLLEAGRIDDAFVAVARGAAPDHFLRWWAERIDDDQDKPWLDLAPDLFADVFVLDDAGYNVSFWNLHERPLEHSGQSTLAGGRPLRSFHFDGFRADRPYWLSDHATRVRVVDDPVLSELCGEYGRRLRAAGWTAPKTNIADIARLGNGERVDHLVRNLWEDAVERGLDFGDPQLRVDADRFVAWIREPAEEGASAGVSRYLLAAHKTRPDLRAAFPDLDGRGGAGLIAWARGPGRYQLLPEFLPAGPDDEITASGDRLAVNVIGYLADTLGLAEAARLYVKGLGAAGVPVITTAVPPDLPVGGDQTITRAGNHPYENLSASVTPAFNLVCLNGDQFETFIAAGGDGLLEGRPTIGQWNWETDALPPSWMGAFRHLDEVWVNSMFVAENLGRVSPVPVVMVPFVITVPDVAGVDPGLDWDERFTFVFMLDFFSTLRRKNALGLIDAFTRAFTPGEGPRLVLKTLNASFRPRDADQLRSRIARRPDIELIDRYLEPMQKYALLARADCYVSLHRSEGFGISLAEAMALGTPVIATGYSGNTDFMTDQNSYLVDWRPTRVGVGCEIYPEDGVWAEPDLDHAAELMRRVWEHPDEATSKAARARADIERLYAPQVAGAIARTRLERLADNRSRGVSRQAVSESAQTIRRVLSLDLKEGAPPAPRGISGGIRRLVLRLIYPFTFHERELDRAMFDELRQLRTELDEVKDQRMGDQARMRRAEDLAARGVQPKPSDAGARPPVAPRSHSSIARRGDPE